MRIALKATASKIESETFSYMIPLSAKVLALHPTKVKSYTNCMAILKYKLKYKTFNWYLFNK